MFENAKWIQSEREFYKDTKCGVTFFKDFSAKAPVKNAVLSITGLGVYTAELNGRPVTDSVLNPGCTEYPKRHQYQQFNVTHLLEQNNQFQVDLGAGWVLGWESATGFKYRIGGRTPRPAILVQLDIEYGDGTAEQVVSDLNWTCSESKLRFNSIYDGQTYDATWEHKPEPVALYAHGKKMLIPQEGEWIREQETFAPIEVITTSKGETVLDFGQEITGYVEFTVDGKVGDKVELSCAEVLDKAGNFYTENYRGAKSKTVYICRDGLQTHKPQHTFYGFRYIRVDAYPGKVDPKNFKAIVVHSDIQRTGYFECSDPLLNRWYQNSVWSNKDNFLDIPTDCPQRDERLGWTGDIQAFIKAASYHFDVEKFMRKWLRDVLAAQMPDGGVPQMVPDVFKDKGNYKAAWADAITVCPWQLYQAYGNLDVLAEMYEGMKKWVDCITDMTPVPYVWAGQYQLGDWLALDVYEGSYKGASNETMMGTAYYAKSTQIVVESAKLLGYTADAETYGELYQNIVKIYHATYNDTFKTQTEHALSIEFGLCKDPQKVADSLADLVRRDGCMKTGFMGTPVLLHALSNYGYGDLAWDLMLRREYPSWLYAVTKGATTIWEHLDGIKPDGSFWSKDMNSFNHYAYGAAADWLYGVAAGITPAEPGYKRVRVVPLPTEKLGHLRVELDTREGKVISAWKKTENGFAYQITVPVEAEIVIAGQTRTVKAGSYEFTA